MTSNWIKAVDLICPKCQAQNRPNATIIEVDGETAVCCVCSHHWLVKVRP